MSGRFKKWAPEIGAALLLVFAAALLVAIRSPVRSAPELALFLGRFHPLAVHLPIGILLLLALCEALSLLPSMRSRLDPAIGVGLAALVVSGVGAFALGALLSTGGGFSPKLLSQHKNLTFVALLAMGLSFVAFRQAERAGSSAWRWAHRGALACAVLVLSLGAHHGGSLTRGEGYLTRYAPGPLKGLLGIEEPKPAPTSEPGSGAEPLVYADVVAPILRERCYDCHGPKEQKGKLRLDSLAAMLEGGKEGPALVAGDAAQSPLVTRMLLPEGHDERMPPEDEPGPSPEEIELIRFWVARGASDTMRVRDLLPPIAARSVLERGLSGEGSARATASPSSSARSSAAPSGEPSAPASSEPATDPSASVSATSEPGGASTTAVPVEAASLYDAKVAPILQARCGKCHGGSKKKGRLSVDTLDALLKGGKAGAAIVPGSPKGSPLLARVHLPLDDEEHMPPADEPQMTDSEIAIVSFFIERGATRELAVSELPAHLRGTRPPRPAPTATTTTATTTTAAPPIAQTSAPPAASSGASSLPPVASSTAPPAASASAPPVDLSKLPAKIDLFADLAQPILLERCASCHDDDGQGDLSVLTHASLAKGGASGPAFVPGDVANSLLVSRTRLPLAHDEHMPPDNMEQPSEGELAALELWVATGAKETLLVDTATLGPAVLGALAAALAARPPAALPSPGPTPSSSAASPPLPPSARATASSRPADDEPGNAPPATSGGGCASCSLGARGDATSTFASLWLAGLGLAALWLRRRGRP